MSILEQKSSYRQRLQIVRDLDPKSSSTQPASQPSLQPSSLPLSSYLYRDADYSASSAFKKDSSSIFKKEYQEDADLQHIGTSSIESKLNMINAFSTSEKRLVDDIYDIYGTSMGDNTALSSTGIES